MTDIEIKKMLADHLAWINGDSEGVRADLIDVDLRGADLRGADLRGADLRGADLRGADLMGTILNGANLCEATLDGADLYRANLIRVDLYRANLVGADLCWANLIGSNLVGANLVGADLVGADLHGSNFRDADLRKADLQGVIHYDACFYNADFREAKNIPFLPETIVAPEEGAFIAWKKIDDFLIKLRIPAKAKRSSATTRMCRCEYAKVLKITHVETGEAINSITNYNIYAECVYTVGELVYPDIWDDDRWYECSHGIHFFMTKQEAIDY